MAKPRTLVGLDVHAAKIVAAILDPDSGELREARFGGETAAVLELCSSLPEPVRAAYEAGPTGYGLARQLERAGVECVVAAPGKIPRAPTDRIKTDRRDAEHLVRLLLAGKLHRVRVPGPAEEALRDLVRAREDVRGDLMRARHRLSKQLLRHGLRFEGRHWTQRHHDWLAGVQLEESAAQAALEDYRGAIEVTMARRRELESEIERRISGSPWADAVARLRCLRGIDTLSAAGLCAEIGDFTRFSRAGELMSFVGLVPSEQLHGHPAPAGRDHPLRLAPRAPPARRGRVAQPPPTASRQEVGESPGRSAAGGGPGLLVCTAEAASHLDADGAPRQAQDADRGGCRTRAGRLLLGDHKDGLIAQTRLQLGGRRRSTFARGHPREALEQPTLSVGEARS